jgi:predicted unusual protein kinase regulating ubiquinone biosynthesis (AarF/ABC1/UbiB family)
VARAWTTGKRAILSDSDVTTDTADSERAEADAFARSAEVLRGGVAKWAQLRGYLDGSAPDARARLAALWDRMPGDDPARIRGVIREQLGGEPGTLFARWDDQPLAAASLGQVHAAEDAEGHQLAVKVQYPEVAAALRDDLAAPGLLRRLVGSDMGATVDEAALDALRVHLLAELDYRAEARHLERFRAACEGEPRMVVPCVFPRFSSERVLTMERLTGRPLPELVRDGNQEERTEVARTILTFALGSPILHGRINADPHPGNYLVLDAAAGRVGFVDFGCVAELPENVLRAERKLWRALIVREGEMLRHAAHEEGLVLDADVFNGATWREWERRFGEPFLTRGEFELTPSHARELLELTGELMRGHKLRLPAATLLLWRQRLGTLVVVADLRPRLDFRRLLAGLIDDGHPVPMLDRYP